MASTSKTTRFLTASQVRHLYQRCIISAVPTQPTMLESAVDSPVNHQYYGENNIFRLAGLLATKVLQNHAFQDGNKRTALFAADMFLKINGQRLQTKPKGRDDEELNEALASAHVAVATGKWNAEDLGSYYEKIAEPVQHKGGERRG